MGGLELKYKITEQYKDRTLEIFIVCYYVALGGRMGGVGCCLGFRFLRVFSFLIYSCFCGQMLPSLRPLLV
jgi:hypothetical protein